jgi:hypothetical protein
MQRGQTPLNQRLLLDYFWREIDHNTRLLITVPTKHNITIYYLLILYQLMLLNA